jgi:hypothetical protein
MEIDRNGLEVLTRAEAIALLRTQQVGRLVYTRRTLPAITPVNYVVGDSALLVWTGPLWTVAPAVCGTLVAFEVDEVNRALCRGWSVSVTGRAAPATDPLEWAWACLDGPVPWVTAPGDGLLRIPLMVVTGRWLGPRDREPADHPGRQPHGSYPEHACLPWP